MKIVLSNQAKFTPYTFEELLKVPAMYTEEYNTIEDAYIDSIAKAELLKKYANEEPDSPWAKELNAYIKSGEAAVDEMIRNGLQGNTRSKLKKYIKNYNSSVSPVEQAALKREKLYEERSKNPNNFYKNKVVPLSKIIDNSFDNSYITEKDIIDSMALNYDPVFRGAYSDAIMSGANVQEALDRAIEVASPQLGTQSAYIESMGYDSEDPRIKKALKDGVNASISGVMKDEIMGYKEWQAIQRAEATQALQEAQFRANQQARDRDYNLQLTELRLKYPHLFGTTSDDEPIDLGTRPGINRVEILSNTKDLGEWINPDGALKKNYFGDKDGKFVNPMKVYEDYQKEMQNIEIGTYPGDEHYYFAKLQQLNAKYKAMYGHPVITSEQYNQLKELGYTSESTSKDFRNTLKDRIDEAVKLNVATSINLAGLNSHSNQPKWASDFLGLSDFSSKVFDYTTEKPMSIGDLKDTNDNVSKIVDLQYDTNKNNQIIVQFENGKVALVNKDFFGMDVASMIDGHREQLQRADSLLGTAKPYNKRKNENDTTYTKKDIAKLKAEIEKQAAAELRAIIESGIPRQSTTTSKDVLVPQGN